MSKCESGSDLFGAEIERARMKSSAALLFDSSSHITSISTPDIDFNK